MSIGNEVKATNVMWSGEQLEVLKKGFELWKKENPTGTQSQFIREAVCSYIDGVLEANQPEGDVQ
jgi:hypothetical protein